MVYGSVFFPGCKFVEITDYSNGPSQEGADSVGSDEEVGARKKHSGICCFDQRDN